MARSTDFISNLARRSPAYKATVLIGVAGVLGFLYWQFPYSTLKDDQKRLQAQRVDLVKKVEALHERESKYNEMLQQKEALDQQLAKNALVLPSSSELPAFFLHLQKQAGASQVTLRSWKRLKELPVETYVKVPVAIEVSGTFYQITNYFKLLYDTDRIITVEKLHIGDPVIRNDEVILTATFNAATFRQKDLPPDTSLDEDKPAGAAGGKVGQATRDREKKVEEKSGEEDRSGGAGAAPAALPESAPKAGIEHLTNPGAGLPDE